MEIDVEELLDHEMEYAHMAFDGSRWMQTIIATHASGNKTMLVGAEGVDECLLGLAALQAGELTPVGKGDPVIAASLVVDTYCLNLRMRRGNRPTPLRGGELEERFLNGDPEVYEAINIQCITLTDKAAATMPYVRTPGGISWQEPLLKGEIEGRLFMVIRAVLTLTNPEESHE